VGGIGCILSGNGYDVSYRDKNNAFALYAKRLERDKVAPKLKIELEDTDGKVAKGKLAKSHPLCLSIT